MPLLVQRRIQHDHVLQARDIGVQAAHRDVERPVLPEQIIGHNRIGEARALERRNRAIHPGSLHADQVLSVKSDFQPGWQRYRRRRRLASCLSADCRAVWWTDVSQRGQVGVEEHSRRRCRIVVHHCVVDEVDAQRILHRNTSATPTCHVVDDDVIGDVHVIPGRRVGWAATYVAAVHQLQAQTAAFAAFGHIALEQVRVDGEIGPDSVSQRRRAIGVNQRVLAEVPVLRNTLSDKPAAVGWEGRILALVEENPIVLDVAVVAEAKVRDAAAVPAAEVPAHKIVLELVVVGAGAEGDTSGRGWRRRVDFVAVGCIQCDRVVMHVHKLVVSEWQFRHVVHRRDVCGRNLDLAHSYSAGEGTGVSMHTVVGNLQVMSPAVNQDTAAALRAVCEANSIDTRRIAQEVAARIRIRGIRIGAAIRRCQRHAVRRVQRIADARSVGVQQSLGEHCDSGTLVSSHEGRFLQHSRQIAVEVGVPADQRLERDWIHLRQSAKRATVSAVRIVRVLAADEVAVQRDAEEAVHLSPPGIQSPRRVSVGVDGNRGRPNTLQADWFPHQQHLVIGARAYQDQVSGRGVIQRRLECVIGGILAIDEHSRGLAADGHGHCIDGFLSIGRCDHQFSALRSGLPDLRHFASSDAVGHRHLKRVSPSAHQCGRDATDRDGSRSGTETVVPGDELLVEWRDNGYWSRIGRIQNKLVAQRLDCQRAANGAYPRSRTTAHAVSCNTGDRRGSIRVGAIGWIVTIREGGNRHDWRIHVLR